MGSGREERVRRTEKLARFWSLVEDAVVVLGGMLEEEVWSCWYCGFRDARRRDLSL